MGEVILVRGKASVKRGDFSRGILVGDGVFVGGSVEGFCWEREAVLGIWWEGGSGDFVVTQINSILLKWWWLPCVLICLSLHVQ